jgi:hypothetical protein
MFSIPAQKLRAKLFSFEKHQPNCERTFLQMAGSRYENKKANMITAKIIKEFQTCLSLLTYTSIQLLCF